MKHPLKVGWFEDQRLRDGGCWALFKENGKPFLLAAKSGRRSCTEAKMKALAETWNLWSPVGAPEIKNTRPKEVETA